LTKADFGCASPFGPCAGVFDYLIEGRIERAMVVVNGQGSRADRLRQAFEIMLVEPWGQGRWTSDDR
jgi:hypothetical protein